MKPETELTDVDVRNHDEFFKRLFNNTISAFSIFFSILHCLPAGMADQPSAGRI